MNVSKRLWARTARVSPTTLIAYLRDPGSILPTTRERIECAAAKLGAVEQTVREPHANFTRPGKAEKTDGQEALS